MPTGKYGLKREDTTRGQNENIAWNLIIYSLDNTRLVKLRSKG